MIQAPLREVPTPVTTLHSLCPCRPIPYVLFMCAWIGLWRLLEQSTGSSLKVEERLGASRSGSLELWKKAEIVKASLQPKAELFKASLQPKARNCKHRCHHGSQKGSSWPLIWLSPSADFCQPCPVTPGLRAHRSLRQEQVGVSLQDVRDDVLHVEGARLQQHCLWQRLHHHHGLVSLGMDDTDQWHLRQLMPGRLNLTLPLGHLGRAEMRTMKTTQDLVCQSLSVTFPVH